VIDFALALDEAGDVDGWSSDDSFEEKVTWSRHRMRVTPGGFTPRNIQVGAPIQSHSMPDAVFCSSVLCWMQSVVDFKLVFWGGWGD